MIKIRYSTIDRFSKTRKFATQESARKFAVKYVGENPEFGSHYAISCDGIGKVTVEGCTLRELFYGAVKADGPFEVRVGIVNEDCGTSGFYKDRAFATLAEANAYALDLDNQGAFDGLEIVGTTDEAKAEIAASISRQAITIEDFADPYKPHRSTGCTCSDMQLNRVGCDCDATF